ncbi:MAG: ATP-binding cassette domain-containing protein [Rhizobium sp.]|nr:ATP-binding cassette domain-containing protein [Rhizobium sp.]
MATLIGANGAGKSTLMMTICGMPQARTGSVVFQGRDITRMPTHEIARLRIAQSAGGSPHLSAHDRLREPADGCVSRQPGIFCRGREAHLRTVPAARRSGRRSAAARFRAGEQQMLSIGRALMAATQAAAARRTFARPGAADLQADFRGHRQAQQGGRPFGFPRRAERLCRAPPGASRLRDGQRSRDNAGFRPGTAGQIRKCVPAYLEGRSPLRKFGGEPCARGAKE